MRCFILTFEYGERLSSTGGSRLVGSVLLQKSELGPMGGGYWEAVLS